MSDPRLIAELRYYRPAIAIAWLVSGPVFIALRFVLVSLMLVSVGILLFSNIPIFFGLPPLSLPQLDSFPSMGISFLAAGVYICIRVLSFFYNERYFHGLDTVIANQSAEYNLTYEVASLFVRSPQDITGGFLTTHFGQKVLMRAGIELEQLNAFQISTRQPVNLDGMSVSLDSQYTMYDVALQLQKTDVALQTLLQEQGITDAIFEGALSWTYQEHLVRKRLKRWWSRDQLSTTTGIGRDFSYGVAYTLSEFTKPIASGAVYPEVAHNPLFAAEYIPTIETILARTGDSNVLLVGESGVGKLDAVLAVGERMERGVAVGAIRSMHLILLDTDKLIAVAADKSVLEQSLLKILTEAENAGNIVLVIDKLPDFLRNASSLGVDVSSLLDQYLASPALHIIATTDTATYHQDIETNGGLLRRFETVQIEPPAESVTIMLLESMLTQLEVEGNTACTYAAVAAIVKDADHYIVSGVMPDKAVQLLNGIIAAAKAQNVSVITETFVNTFVAEKTGVPVGPVLEAERNKLMNLEVVLHERIIGQDRAIDAISGAMRRSRAGIQDDNKPIGSFLFLGPTGVGKTECAKALAAAFFDSDEAMHRLDMSEFSGNDALHRLIGGDGHTGVLSNMLKEHPYAVLLLDEFEKSQPKVHDLFLQILDEGVFTDGLGQKINARNVIIIATSNAGSERIIEWMQNGESLDDKKDALVDHVIHVGMYKPELVNRFDDVVLFTPLNESEQTSIARALLIQLKKRIIEKGYNLEISEPLVDAVVKVGYQPEFGARPMRRAIQEIVEEAVAGKIIAGTIHKGDTINFTAEELKSFTLR